MHEHSADLFSLVRDYSGGTLPIALFNTHWHWDHTGANERFGKAGVPIIAHENTKLWLGMEFTVAWENRDYLPRPKLALPTQTFFRGPQKFEAAGLALDYGWLPRAHTDGDLYVHIPERNVLVTGDLFVVDRYPVVDVDTGGWIGRTGPSARIRAAQKLSEERDCGTAPSLHRLEWRPDRCELRAARPVRRAHHRHPGQSARHSAGAILPRRTQCWRSSATGWMN